MNAQIVDEEILIEDPRPARTDFTALSFIHRIESWWGVFCAAWILCGVGFICVAIAIEAVFTPLSHKNFYSLALILPTFPVLRLTLPTLWRTWKTLWLGQYPVPPNAALTLSLPIYLRPIAFIWWSGHLLTSVMMAYQLDRLFSWSASQPVIRFAIGACLLFGITYGSNLFLLLAATAIGLREKTVWCIWQRRIWADVLLAGVGLLVGVLHAYLGLS